MPSFPHRSRWVISHVPFATPDLLNRLKKIGAAVQLTGWRYLQGSATNNGSPFRMVLKNGIRAGLHSDSAHISPLNPWLHLYYATTGVNAAGESINGDQRISGQDALRLYAGERMVPADGAETRRDRGREAGRPGRPERRLLRRARRSDQKNPVGDDGCRWKNRSRCGRAEVACSNDEHSFDEGAHLDAGHPVMGATEGAAWPRREESRGRARPRGKKKSSGRKANAAFMAPVTPSDKLTPVVGSKPIPRTEVTKRLWAYIKKNKLQDQNNKRMIKADATLKPVFGGKATVNMFEMTKLVNKHLSK